MQLFIEPNDVWLFRDGKPFIASANHRAVSRFPPSPTTIQGAIRSKVLLESGVSLAAYIAEEETTALQEVAAKIGWPSSRELPFRLSGPFLAQRENINGKVTRLYPPPADLAVTKSENKRARRYFSLKPITNTPFFTDLGDSVNLLWAKTSERLTAVEGWLTEDQLEAYLDDADAFTKSLNECQAETDEDLLIQNSKLFVRESRVGNALEHQKRRPMEHMLFEVEYIRPRQDVGLLVEIASSSGQLPAPIADSFGSQGSCGMMGLGGENRLARWEVIDDKLSPPPSIRSTFFKVILITPAIFKEGWKSANWNKFFSKPVTLCAAAVKSPEIISGWDLAANKPKPARPIVPAGSVYFFKSEEVTTINVNEAFTDQGSDLGFGQIQIGGWNV